MQLAPVDKNIKFELDQALLKLENKLNSDVITFYGPIVNGVEKTFKDMIEDIDNKKEKLHIILTTPGGSLNPVERMVNIARRFYKEVNFIVPNYAYSAGTIFCMSGDNIFMNYFSVLGPIDPQVQNKEGKLVAALGYLDKINDLLQKAQAGTISQAEFLILKDFDLAELREYEQSKNLAIDLLKKWLVKYKFKNWDIHSSDKRAVTCDDKLLRAEEIASDLSDNNRWKSHGRPINIEDLKILRLLIEDLSEPKYNDLNILVDSYYWLLEDYIRRNNFEFYFHSRRWN